MGGETTHADSRVRSRKAGDPGQEAEVGAMRSPPSRRSSRIPDPPLPRLPTSRAGSKRSHAQETAPTAPRRSPTGVSRIRSTSVMRTSQTPAETGSRGEGLFMIANQRRGPSPRGQSVAWGEGLSSGRAELVVGFVEGHQLRNL